MESYELALYFAAYKTSCDAWEKRQKKGYLFTLGDERFYGSASVVSLRDLPPDPAELAKKSKPRSPQELLAMLGLKPKD